METTLIAIPPENYTTALTLSFAKKHLNNWTAICDEIIEHISHNDATWPLFNVDKQLWRYELNSLHSEQRTVANIWHVFHAIWASANEIEEYIRWGDKTPNNAYHLPQIFRLFPEVKFIFMLRDPYDTVQSMMESFGDSYTPSQAALRWNRANTKILNFTSRIISNHIFVYYEHLVSNPTEQIARCLEFLELPKSQGSNITSSMRDVDYWPHLSNTFQSVTTASVNQGRGKLSNVAFSSVSEICGELATRLKYPSP